MKKAEFAVLTGLIVSIILSSVSAFASDCQKIRGNVLRLHILANSDSEYDQSIKLKVRDAILENSSVLFDGAQNLSEAEKSAKKHLDEIKAVADSTLKQNGCDMTAEVSIEDVYFETRVYDDVTLPAGVYRALRVKIGKAQGKNWWCVLFPALCIPAAQKSEELSKAFTESEISKVTEPKYRAKFAIIELIEKIKNK